MMVIMRDMKLIKRHYMIAKRVQIKQFYYGKKRNITNVLIMKCENKFTIIFNLNPTQLLNLSNYRPGCFVNECSLIINRDFLGKE